MAASVIQFEALSRRFGKALALDHVNLEVSPGSVYGLVGANGAGKTTLISIGWQVATVQPPVQTAFVAYLIVGALLVSTLASAAYAPLALAAHRHQ